MLISNTLLAAALLIASSIAVSTPNTAPKWPKPGLEPPIENVFRVQTKANGDKIGLCDNFLKSKGNQQPDKELNIMWRQLYQLNQAAWKATALNQLRQNQASANLAHAFFAIKTNPKELSTEDELRRRYAQRLAEAAHDVLTLRARLKLGKPHLICGSDGLRYLDPDSFIGKNANGHWIPMGATEVEDSITFRTFANEVLKQTDATIASRWYFFSTVPQIPGFLSLNKNTLPKPAANQKTPFQGNPETLGKPDLCYGQSSGGMVLNEYAQGSRPPVVLICPDAFKRFPAGATQIDANVGDAKTLDDKGVNALTLYRLLVQLAVPRGSSPQDVRRRKRNAPGEIQFSPINWYDSSSRWEDVPTLKATGALESLYLGLYDMIEPSKDNHGSQENNGEAQKKLRNATSIRNPDSHAWFALAAYLQANGHTDWSTGEPRPLGQPYAPVTAKNKEVP